MTHRQNPPKIWGGFVWLFFLWGGFVQIDIAILMKFTTKKQITGFQCPDKTPPKWGGFVWPIIFCD